MAKKTPLVPLVSQEEQKIMEDWQKVRTPGRRKKLIKFIRHVNILNPFPSESSWEYVTLDRHVTDEMLDLMLKMNLRQKYYIPELAEVAGMPVERVAELVEQLGYTGVLEFCLDHDGVDMIKLPILVPGTIEIMCVEKWRTDQYPELAPGFMNYGREMPNRISKFMPNSAALMRAVPVQKSIAHNPHRADYEEVSYWIEKYGNENRLGVIECECRRCRRMVGEATHDLEGEVCIILGELVDALIRHGKEVRRIDKEEAYAIVRKSEERGYVHQASNVDGSNEAFALCNCEYTTCIALRTNWYVGAPNMSRSNYLAQVDAEKCVACGACMEICPQNAARLSQKLCEKVPTKIKPTPTAHDHVWSKKKWPGKDFLVTRKDVLETGTAPCKVNCPAHVSVQGYLQKAAEGKYLEALEVIKKKNPLPAVCGRICSRKCEDVCTRGDVDSPVAIDEVKKFIAQQELNAETRFVPTKLYDKGKKIAVIGSGPAGISCAYYLAVYGHDVTVFEKEQRLGGMLTLGIPSFRLEKDVIEAEIDVLRELGVQFVTGVEVGKDTTIQQLRDDGYLGFYLAIGAQGGRKLGLAGEDAQGVTSGVDFLRSVNLGDVPTLSGDVVVIGGGNVAIDVARTAVRCGGNNVALYCLESKDEMPAAEDEIEETLHENVAIHCGWGPKEIVTENGTVTGVLFQRCTRVKDETGRFAPQFSDETMLVKADFVLPAIGQTIEWGNLLDGTDVQLNANATVVADSFTYATAQRDIFAGGDAFTGPSFAIDAIAAGKQGAESLHRAVWEGHHLVLGRDRLEYHYLNKDNMVIGDYDSTPRQKAAHNAAKACTFADDREIFTEEQVKLEAARCLKCGIAHVDQNTCIGCGLCAAHCKFDAVRLDRKFDAHGVPYELLPLKVVKEAVTRPLRIAARAVKRND
ncbi:MAG: FAD-dependent oxidoreductase [Oscillospiraceae bacterium]|nr:FAD-dependent oxidoreductase [Oscillospiraceae bacterium]